MASEVWKYFKIDVVNDQYAKCNLCNKLISRGQSKSTSNLKKHLQTHNVLYLNRPRPHTKVSTNIQPVGLGEAVASTNRPDVRTSLAAFLQPTKPVVPRPSSTFVRPTSETDQDVVPMTTSTLGLARPTSGMDQSDIGLGPSNEFYESNVRPGCSFSEFNTELLKESKSILGLTISL